MAATELSAARPLRPASPLRAPPPPPLRLGAPRIGARARPDWQTPEYRPMLSADWQRALRRPNPPEWELAGAVHPGLAPSVHADHPVHTPHWAARFAHSSR